jgi:ABC-type Fe3+ transport system substrate-binding protein
LFVYFVIAFGDVSAQTKGDWEVNWKNTLTAGTKETKVVVYGPPGNVIRKVLTEEFKKAFPTLELEYTGGTGNLLASKLRAERDGGIHSVDVILSGANTGTLTLKPMGALDPIEPILILPEVRNRKLWRDQELHFADSEKRLVLTFVAQVSPVAVYDPRQVRPEEINELKKLLNPKWKGEIVLNDPIQGGAGAPFFRLMWVKLGAEKARDYYKRLRTQIGSVTRNTRSQLEWVARGKSAIGLAPSDASIGQLEGQGLTFGVLREFEDIGARLTASYGCVMLVNGAPHPNAAAVFVNWLLSKEGQTVWSKALQHKSRRNDVPVDHLSSYQIPVPQGNYWDSTVETAQRRTPEEEQIVRKLFAK